MEFVGASYYEKNKERIKARVSAYKKTHRARYNELNRAYKIRNTDKVAAYNKANVHLQKIRSQRRYEKNKESILAQQRDEYRKDKDRFLSRNAAYRKANREAVRDTQREYKRQRLLNDPAFHFAECARRRILNALNGVGEKSARTMELLGCTGSEAVAHIARQFKPGMSWANRREWHIDHIKPLAKFDLTDREQQSIAFHYTNLQPLWAKENRQKAAK